MLSHYVISSVIGITVIIYIINSIRINIIAIIIDVIGSMLKEDLSASDIVFGITAIIRNVSIISNVIIITFIPIGFCSLNVGISIIVYNTRRHHQVDHHHQQQQHY